MIQELAVRRVEPVSKQEMIELNKLIADKDRSKHVDCSYAANFLIVGQSRHMYLVFWQSCEDNTQNSSVPFGIGYSLSEAVKNATPMTAPISSTGNYKIGGSGIEVEVWFKDGEPYFKMLFDLVRYTNEKPVEAHWHPLNFGVRLSLVQ